MNALVSEALAAVPSAILERIGPVEIREAPDRGTAWGGVLHSAHVDSYRDANFFSSPVEHQSHMPHWRRRPVIALQPGATPRTVVHELGHALMWAILRPHARWRVFWDPVDGEVVRRFESGMAPPMLWVSYYHPTRFVEQFADAFDAWLAPTRWPCRAHRGDPLPERLYAATRWTDNRDPLAFFNELAALPSDTPPVALR